MFGRGTARHAPTTLNELLKFSIPTKHPSYFAEIRRFQYSGMLYFSGNLLIY